MTPAVVIRLEFKAAPKVMPDCLTESRERNLRDWLNTHPRLVELLSQALELRNAAA